MQSHLVVLDLAACVVFSDEGLRRCLDMALRTSVELRHVYSALDRVLSAHATCDPFVHEVNGTTRFLRRIGRPVIAVASFALPVANAIVRRFRWDGLLTLAPHHENLPLWDSGQSAALQRGYAPTDVAFLSDDPWEVAYARGHGCGDAIRIGEGLSLFESLTLFGPGRPTPNGPRSIHLMPGTA